MHAEVEHYLEGVALKVLERTLSQWRRHQRVGAVLAAVLTYRQSATSIQDDQLSNDQRNGRLTELVNRAIATQRGAISANHGIKQRNVNELFVPLGLQERDVPEHLLIQLNNFGSRRGELVHKSGSVSLTNIRDPFNDEKRDVELLLDRLEDFDSITSSLR